MKKLPNMILLKFVLTGSLFLFTSCEKKDNIPDCEEAYKLAKSDFDQGKYIYYEYQYLNQDKSGNEAFKNTLKQKNIKVLFKTKHPASCIPDDSNELEKSKNCYRLQMNLGIESKFGHKFLDSARSEAKKLHGKSK
ncbi:hypothetical protein [Chryseobacterium sp. Leaf180]|uniref:hypothetical protein n=1 Tax=Chryseobacterium sp. Leaf180 TaxID=1736289 RepID=UPI000B0E1F8E|nr:hypothetical protein [Chryseobacterium sp. Leaf180]